MRGHRVRERAWGADRKEGRPSTQARAGPDGRHAGGAAEEGDAGHQHRPGRRLRPAAGRAGKVGGPPSREAARMGAKPRPIFKTGDRMGGPTAGRGRGLASGIMRPKPTLGFGRLQVPLDSFGRASLLKAADSRRPQAGRSPSPCSRLLPTHVGWCLRVVAPDTEESKSISPPRENRAGRALSGLRHWSCGRAHPRRRPNCREAPQ